MMILESATKRLKTVKPEKRVRVLFLLAYGAVNETEQESFAYLNTQP